MISFLKKESALTIIEVLVAIILTAIVMLHGTLFFMASWRLSAESKEYSMILDDVIANLENCVSIASSNYTPYPSDNTKGSAPDTEYIVKTGDRKLRNNQYTVTYLLEKQKMNYHQFFYVTSSARWRYDNAASSDSDNVINIKTAYYCRLDSRIPTTDWRS